MIEVEEIKFMSSLVRLKVVIPRGFVTTRALRAIVMFSGQRKSSVYKQV